MTWRDTQQLHLLSNSKDINERSARDGDVSIKQELGRATIDRAGDLTVKSKGEAELITSLRMMKNILGMNPVFRSL